MYRQAFSCSGMTRSFFNSHFVPWINDVLLLRQFIVDDHSKELLIVGQEAYPYLMTMPDDLVDKTLDDKGRIAFINKIPVVTPFFQQAQHKESYDVESMCIEYRVEDE